MLLWLPQIPIQRLTVHETLTHHKEHPEGTLDSWFMFCHNFIKRNMFSHTSLCVVLCVYNTQPILISSSIGICSVFPVGHVELCLNNAWIRSDIIVTGFDGILELSFLLLSWFC